MKKKRSLRMAFPAILLLLPFIVSCSAESHPDSLDNGVLSLRFYGNPEEQSKVSAELPDTNDFLISLTDEEGKPVFEGLYRDIPETFELQPGSYSVLARSSEFSGPAFSQPQYGDEQCVVIPPGKTVSVELDCRQINSGLRLHVSPRFLEEFPDGVLFLKSGRKKLMYGYSEKRIAYFLPGSVSVVLYNEGKETVLMTRTLVSQEILTLKIEVSSSEPLGRRGISVSIDTSRVWSNETFLIGDSDSKGSGHQEALTVSQAKGSVGREDVWVSGFVVGGDLTRTSARYEAPFKSSSNLLLAPRSASASRDHCISVQLSAPDVRDALNLADHPEMLGRLVCLNGDIVGSYFGLVGLKNVSDFIIK